MTTAKEVGLRFASALAAGDLPAAEALLYVSPLESHPMLRRVSPKARAGLVGVPSAARAEILRKSFSEEHGFWRNADIDDLIERQISSDCVELYFWTRSAETNELQWRCLLMQKAETEWKVYELTRAIIEKAVAYLPGAPELNISGWRAAFVAQFGDECVEWVEDDSLLRLGVHSLRLRRLDPEPQFARFDHLSAEAKQAVAAHRDVLEVSLDLRAEREERWSQLAAFSRALWTFAATGAPAVYLPVSNVMEEASSVKSMLASASPVPEELAPFWVNFSRNEDFHYTRGMSHFMLPEIEVPARGKDRTRQDLCINLALHQLRNGPVFVPGNTIGSGPLPEWRIVTGSRGPNATETFGLWGSIRLDPSK